MSSEENKALIRRAVEAVNRHDLAIIDELIAPDYVDHTNPIRSPQDVKEFYAEFFKRALKTKNVKYGVFSRCMWGEI